MGDIVAIRATVQKYSEHSPSSSGATSGPDLLLKPHKQAPLGHTIKKEDVSCPPSPCPTSPIVKAALLLFPIAQSFTPDSIHQDLFALGYILAVRNC
jgi:hypothetical protein